MEYAILFLPLVGAFIAGFFGRKIGDRNCQYFTSLLVGISAALSLLVFYKILFQDYQSNKLIFNWISSGNFVVNWSITYPIDIIKTRQITYNMSIINHTSFNQF